MEPTVTIVTTQPSEANLQTPSQPSVDVTALITPLIQQFSELQTALNQLQQQNQQILSHQETMHETLNSLAQEVEATIEEMEEESEPEMTIVEATLPSVEEEDQPEPQTEPSWIHRVLFSE